MIIKISERKLQSSFESTFIRSWSPYNGGKDSVNNKVKTKEDNKLILQFEREKQQEQPGMLPELKRK